MSLIAAGGIKRKMAFDAFGRVAEIDEKEAQIRDGIKAQERAADAQVLGTASGIGAMYGLNKSYAASKAGGEALAGLNDSGLNALGEFSYKGGGLNFQPTGGGELLEGITGIGDITGGVEALTVAPELAVAGEGVTAAGAAATNAAAGIEATTLATTAGEGLVAAGTAAAPATGAMATLGTIAAPIGIALGVGFLINKLFG